MRGSCSCGEIQFELNDKPMFVHCCHCRMCQRQTGTAFALNALIEADSVTLHTGSPETVEMPSKNPFGQKIRRCPKCRVALWSTYPSGGDKFVFVRVGALEDPDAYPPDIHIFTESKQPWVSLPAQIPAVTQFYDRQELWPEASLTRRQRALGEI